MGCFLGCFGLSSNRKRRKPGHRVQPGDHRLGSYEPLGSASASLDVKEEQSINLDSESSCKKSKTPLNCKIKKKVSFNLNVQTYEPIPKEEEEEEEEESRDRFCEDYDEENSKEEINKQNTKEDLAKTKAGSYPSNYRYRNCIDSYDEEDEIAYEESDLEDEDDDEGDDSDEDYGIDDDFDNLRASQDEFYEKLQSVSLSSQTKDSSTRENSENTRPLGDLKMVGMNRNARDRNQYIHSVLNPIENLSQWKAVKAKGMRQIKRQRKENVVSEQQEQVIREIAVDASLSNWIASDDSHRSGIASITKSSTQSNASMTSSYDKTFPWRSRDDMPILDITNLEV